MSLRSSPVRKAAGPADLYPESGSEFLRVSTPIQVPRNPGRRAQPSPLPDNLSISPDSPDSLRREIAARRVGDRSVTPYPPPQFSPRVNIGTRSVTPYPNIHRMPSIEMDSGTPNSVVSSSSIKENERFVRSQAPSPSPMKNKRDWTEGSLSSSPERSPSPDSFVFGVPTNTPYPRSRSVSISVVEDDEDSHGILTPFAISRIIEKRLLEIHIFQEFTDLSADITDAYADEDISILCPPNTPVAPRSIRN